jgi:prepilin-type N-terminal cleavage/methylation domain-containing protein
MPNHRLLCRTARNSSRGGFTLVELLVVISIIAILAGVALPAITGAVKKANENAALQVAHGLSLAMFQYCNDNGSYPGNNPSAVPPVNLANSSQAFELMVGPYISNTDALTINGASQTKYTGATPTTGLSSKNVSWDMTVLASGLGVTSNDPDQLPIIMSTGSTITYPPTPGTPGAATAVITTVSLNPFGNDGIAVGYHDCSSAFKVCQTAGQTFNISSASLNPVNTYAQLKP